MKIEDLGNTNPSKSAMPGYNYKRRKKQNSEKKQTKAALYNKYHLTIMRRTKRGKDRKWKAALYNNEQQKNMPPEKQKLVSEELPETRRRLSRTDNDLIIDASFSSN